MFHCKSWSVLVSPNFAFTGSPEPLHQGEHHADIPENTNDLGGSRKTKHPHLPLRVLI